MITYKDLSIVFILAIVVTLLFANCAPPTGTGDYDTTRSEDIVYTGKRIHRYVDQSYNIVCYVYNSNSISCLKLGD